MHSPSNADAISFFMMSPKRRGLPALTRGTLCERCGCVNYRPATISGWIDGGRSAAGDAHVAGDGRPLGAAVDDEVVAFRLAADRLVDGVRQELVALGSTQRGAQVGRIV